MFVPEHMMDQAIILKRACLSDGQVNTVIEDMVRRGDIHVTWNWKHLHYKLSGINGPGTEDASGLSEWLLTRKLKDGLFSEYTTDHMGCLDRVFFEVEGAQAHWKASGDARLIVFDTTHGSNEYGMKLGCLTSVDKHEKTILLGVLLLAKEDARSFAWAFKIFHNATGADLDLMFTDGDVATAAAIREKLPSTVHLLCIWHLAKTVKKHADRLFPSSKHEKQRNIFKLEFGKLLKHGGKGVKQTTT